MSKIRKLSSFKTLCRVEDRKKKNVVRRAATHPSVLYRLRGRPRCFHCRAHCAVDLLSRARVPVERAHNGPRMRRACSSAPVFAPARRGQRSPDSYFSHFTLLQSQDISHGPVPIVAQLGERARPYCCTVVVG